MRISDWSSDVCSSDLISLPDREKSLNRPRRAALQGLFPIRQGYLVGMKATIERAVLLKSLGHVQSVEIGRASCRERVSVRVDLGGRRIIKKKKKCDTQ